MTLKFEIDGLVRLSAICSMALAGAVAVTACGGGSGDVGTTAVAAGSSGSADGVSGSSGAATIQLSNLPQKQTTSVSAAIAYEVPAVSGATVYCRLDSYAPIVCPESFNLGQSAPLSAGTHTVDYYLDTGAGIDVNQPTASYSWTVTTAATTTTTPATTTPAATIASALAALAPTSWEGDGQDANYSGQTITGSDGVVRVQKTADGGYLMRTKQGDPKNWSGNRSEFGWSGQMAMNPGTDYWFAFAFKPQTWGGGRQIFWQVHQDTGTQPSGCNGPTLELQLADGALQINSVTGSSSEWTCNSLLNSTTYAPAIGQWSKFVVHFRPGYLASQSPKTEVWKDGVLVYSSTNINTQPSANDYAKIGIYKWDDSWAGVDQRAAYYSPHYFSTGANLKANADASIAAY